MNQNDKTSQIIELLDETKNIIKSKITSIDKDLALEKLRKAYDSLLNIDFSNIEVKDAISPKEIVQEKQISIKNDINVTEIIIEPQLEVNKVVAKEKAKQEPDKPQVIIEEEENIVEIESALFETVIENKITTTIEEKTIESSKTLSDKYQKTNTKTLSNSLQTQENNISSSRVLKPITNIKSAISLNDRIMFSRDLFNNNNDLYNKTIDSINEMSNFDEAKKIIYSTIKNTDSETFNNFIELISRRFI